MIHCTGFQAVSSFEQWDPLNSDMREEAAVCEHCVASRPGGSVLPTPHPLPPKPGPERALRIPQSLDEDSLKAIEQLVIDNSQPATKHNLAPQLV